MYKIDERVGCIAVVEESFDSNCLSGDLDGVIAFWSGSRGDNGWEVPDWQRKKARALCDTLKGKNTIAELSDALEYIRDYGNYATDGDIRTPDGRIVHVSDFAEEELRKIKQTEDKH